MSRAYSKREIKDMFIKHVRMIASEWSKYENKTPLERCQGTAFSILAMIDGCQVGFPLVNLSIEPAEEDKEYHKSLNENYFERGMIFNDEYSLHDEFYREERERLREERKNATC